MAPRKHIPPPHEGRGLLRHGPSPAGHRSGESHSPKLFENRMAAQDLEIQQLTDDNRRLATTLVALKQDLASAQNEVLKLSDHIRSMRGDSDIEIRSMLDNIKNMELEIKAGENVEKDLHEALAEARRLVLDRQELKSKLQLGTRELDKARADVKRLPELHSELDSLRQEHQSLRETFEYEKALNIKKVEQMRVIEKDIVGMTGEVERLRMEVANAEQRANAPPPYGGPYIAQTTAFHPPVIHGSLGYVDNLSRPPVQMDTGGLLQGVSQYGNSGLAIPPNGGVHVSGGYPSWYGTYNMSHGTR